MNPLLEKHIVRHYVVTSNSEDERVVETNERYEFNADGEALVQRLYGVMGEMNQQSDRLQPRPLGIFCLAIVIMFIAPIVTYAMGYSETAVFLSPLSGLLVPVFNIVWGIFVASPAEKRLREQMRNDPGNPLRALLEQNPNLLPAMLTVKDRHKWCIWSFLPDNFSENVTPQ